MPRDEENYVALFIDWDNLAISTAVDFAGAVPDVRAIVRAAQRSGTVLLARAYAEWNVSSDRLSVYRAGVEPVYAPTFRFEPEPGSQVPRGKSLADPCLVTDCIDTMHLMPDVNIFCLVSGDKDLIPIVRLAQLRGKRVVVIGPDFVAAILREMADEYIPYRALVEMAEGAAVPEVSLPAPRGQRRVSAPQARIGSGNSTQIPRSQATSRIASTSGTRPGPADATVNGNGNGPDVAAASVIAEATADVASSDEALDSGPLFETIGTIVREREQNGKPRLRATNLKDQLLARIAGFDERKYGFTRFKDLLSAAEKAGVIVVSRTGPVQWVTSATAPTSSTAIAPSATADVSVNPVDAALTPEVEPQSGSDQGGQDVDLDVIRFILELRDRSRWLTYTYLLTNLLNHLGKGGSDAAADAAARTTLNKLVQIGVLVVDREPREIEVGGTRHRVRLCHIVDDHPLIISLRGQATPRADAALEGEDALSGEPSSMAESGPVVETEEPVAIQSGSATDETIEAAADSDRYENAPVSAAGADSSGSPAIEESSQVAETARPEPAPVPHESVEAAPATTGDEDSADADGSGDAESVAETPVAPVGASPSASSPTAPLSLSDSYEILRQVVREATGPNRPSTGPAAVKNRLVRRLGAFDEHALGFGKFKDYLLAAERAGIVKIELVGNTARVSLPTE